MKSSPKGAKLFWIAAAAVLVVAYVYVTHGGVRDGGVSRIEIAGAPGERLARHFPSSDTVCEFTPGIKSPPDASTLYTDDNTHDAVQSVRAVCPNIGKRDIPFSFLAVEESVFVGLKGCRVVGVYKIYKGKRPMDGVPQGFCAPPSRLLVTNDGGVGLDP